MKSKKKTKDKDSKDNKALVKNTINLNPTLDEAKDSTVVFTFGRMSPPTVGHEKLVKKVVSVAKQHGAKPMVFVSHSFDSKKNPLPYDKKVNFLKKAFGPIVQKSDAKNVIDILKNLQSQYSKAVMVVGADRVAKFDRLISKYNGKDYKFDSVEVVSAGARDPDAEGVEGMSASKMRAAAEKDDFVMFKSGLPTRLKSSADAVYKEVRQGMNISEEVEDLDEVAYSVNMLKSLHGHTSKYRDKDSAQYAAAKFIKSMKQEKGIDAKVKVEPHPSGTGWQWQHIKEEVEDLEESFSVYKNTATQAKDKAKSIYAFGRRNELKNKPPSEGGYFVFKMKASYSGQVRGGLDKRWVAVAQDLSYEDAIKLMNKKLQYTAFNPPNVKEEVEDLEERVLSVQQRRKRGLLFKRKKAKIMRGREIAKRRMASKPKLEVRARKKAIQLLRKKFAGKQGADYKDLPPAAKVAVDKRIQSKLKNVDRIARRLLPGVTKGERERLKKFHQTESYTPPKRHHMLLDKQGKVKNDRRFRFNRIKEDTDIISIVDDMLINAKFESLLDQ